MKAFFNFLNLALSSILFTIKNKNIDEKAIKKWIDSILEKFKIEIECIGNFSVKNAVVMANHNSYFDVIALYKCFNQKLIWLAKKELFKYPVISKVLKNIEAIEINRDNKREAALSLIKIIKEFKNGIIIVFPFGTRKSKANFKKGGFVIAKKKNIPILPVKIENTEKIMPPNKMLLFSGKITVKAFKEIYFKEKDVENIVRSKICN